MRLLKTISFISLLFYLPLYAQENKEIPASVPTEPTIQELIVQVKNAPDDQKRVIMNQLKTQLKTMNKESRQKTMMELKKSFSKKGTHSQGKHQGNKDTSQHGNHQPKFRHLRQGAQDGSHRGEGQSGGSGHQGNGQK